jgi:hypothetical protein
MERGRDQGSSAGARKKFKTTLTMSANLLLKDGPRRFYLGVVLPRLERAIRGQPRECVWPSVNKFNHKLCAKSWLATGMAELLQNHDVSHKHACVGGIGIPGWLEGLGLWR